jgi:spore maturation protein A
MLIYRHAYLHSSCINIYKPHQEEKLMLNVLWGGMILTAVVYAAFSGTLPELTNAALDSSKEAVSLCITMLGVMSFWTGIMQIATQSGLIERLSKALSPVLTFLFPQLPANHPARAHISTNIIANIFGLGWAATPAGLRAMKALAEDMPKDERKYENRTATTSMCTFLILNISSLQLIPINVIAYRSQYGSVNPASIVGPGIAATAASTIAAVVFCKIMQKVDASKAKIQGL